MLGKFLYSLYRFQIAANISFKFRFIIFIVFDKSLISNNSFQWSNSKKKGRKEKKMWRIKRNFGLKKMIYNIESQTEISFKDKKNTLKLKIF